MHKKTILIMAVAVIALIASGCTSITYSAGPSYVGFYSDGAKTVKQTKKTSYDNDEMMRTYDDEFIYDEEGNVIKQIQTQYFDEANKFDEYVITYQKIGGVVLPESAAINGVVYMEIEYDLLPVEHEGKIPMYTSIPVFYRQINNYLLFEQDFDKWTMDLGNFDVPFAIDGKYVEAEESYDFYSGFDNDSVLTTGYNNILLQKFHYSRAKFEEGYYKTTDPMFAYLSGLEMTENKSTTFNFGWDVKADKLIQTGVEVVETLNDDLTMNFIIKREFDDSARLISEVWTVADTKNGMDEIKTLYKQELSY